MFVVGAICLFACCCCVMFVVRCFCHCCIMFGVCWCGVGDVCFVVFDGFCLMLCLCVVCVGVLLVVSFCLWVFGVVV